MTERLAGALMLAWCLMFMIPSWVFAMNAMFPRGQSNRAVRRLDWRCAGLSFVGTGFLGFWYFTKHLHEAYTGEK